MVKLLVVVHKGKKVKKQKIKDVLNTSETNNISDTEHEHSDTALVCPKICSFATRVPLCCIRDSHILRFTERRLKKVLST